MRTASACLAVALAAAALTGTGTASADPIVAGSQVPDQDPFYAAPADIGTYAPGTPIATRPVALTMPGLTDTDAWQISYRTNDSHGAPELAVTTLAVPKTPWTGSGPRPVISLQLAEDATGTQCAPSYLLAKGALQDAPTAVLAPPMINKGYAVAFPDFEGPKSVYMAGPQAGHAVLDGIRAVKRVKAAGIGEGNPWGLDGYSGGAEATGWAAQLQPSYAPEVKLAGAAIGGTPADPGIVGRSLDGGPFSGFEIGSEYGLMTEFPEARIDTLLNADGKAAMKAAAGKCTNDLLLGFAFKKMSDYVTVPDFSSVPSVAAMLKRNTLGAAAPLAPVYDYHTIADEIVPVGQDDTLVKAWCAGGTSVQSVRDPLGGHVTEALTRSGDALTYLSDRFAHKPAPTTC
ncbi:lipase family protein [Actinomadura rupiterrae]|uniref:lipase family protein n=1 Tax=Actinomadura rupiterrae TaxID=559627 RepID=UPI0020A43032|nr:lipase family protein [Actinomadura rupiterrae]MCP2342118.1 hypothetical protein [Actinomadura rupiterrae]